MIYIAIVENNVDTLKLGRCQVRIFGKHTEDKIVYPTSDLPWATLLINGPAISEQSNFFLPNNGDFVAISFIDPEEQQPIILGTIPKIAKAPDYTKGFSDPNQEHPDSNKLDESGLSRLVRNEEISDTIIQDKKDNVTTGVQCVGTSWSEPQTLYDTTYPYNKVIQTKHHIIELDDTSGKERVHIYHKSGSSIEIHPNGDIIELVKSKRYLVVESDNNVYVGGKWNLHTDGDINIQSDSVINVESSGDTNVESTSGNINITSNSNTNIDAGGDVTVNCDTADIDCDVAELDATTSVDVTSPITTITGNLNVTGQMSSPTMIASSSLKIKGKEMDDHRHSQGLDTNGDGQVNTDGPV